MTFADARRRVEGEAVPMTSRVAISMTWAIAARAFAGGASILVEYV